MVDNTKDLVDKTRVLVDQSRELITRLGPKAEATVSDMSRVARGVRNQIEAVEFTGRDILERTRRQTERLDSMTTEALDRVEFAGRYVADSVVRPMRQLAGIMAAAKAIVGSLRGKVPQHTRYYDDEEPFV
jgi:methyl-accepting chemotaxis protein